MSFFWGMKTSFIKIFIVFFTVFAQLLSIGIALENSSITIDFDNVLKQAKAQSYDIQIADFDVFIAKQGVRTARSEYFPKF